MSLKAFHIIFIIASTVLAFGFGVWELKSYFAVEEKQPLLLGIFSIVAGIALIWYGKIVLKKLKHISYL